MSLDVSLRPLLTAILNHLDCAVILEDVNRTVLFANRLYYQLWGLSDDNVLGQSGAAVASKVAHLVGDTEFFNGLLTTAHERREIMLGLEVNLIDGRILEFDYAPVSIGESFQGHLWQMRDITARKLAEEDRKKTQQFMELFFSQSIDGCFFMMLDEPVPWNDTIDKEAALEYVLEHQRLTRVNDALAAQYGTTPEGILGKTPKELFSGNIDYAKSIWRQFFDAGRLRIDTKESNVQGAEIWIEGDYICMYDESGRITGHFGIQRDVTDKRNAEAAIRHQAYHDSLTGLPNRLLFRDRLEIALSQAERDNRMMALLFLDCYQFKKINDQFGHLCGDRILQIVAGRLLECVRKGDTVARLGGDEFVIVLPRVKNHDEICLVAQRILQAFHQPIVSNGAVAELGASIGISVYPNDAADADRLLSAADEAMYRCKTRGSHIYCFYRDPILK